jgi:hypothetical protein
MMRISIHFCESSLRFTWTSTSIDFSDPKDLISNDPESSFFALRI